MSTPVADRDQRAADFLRRVADGDTQQQVARDTGYSLRLVRLELTWLKRGIGAVSTTHAVRLATLAGVI